MDIILTAIGEFVWAASCGAVNFCLTSGLSVFAIFISLLSIILASGLFKYMSVRDGTAMDLDEKQNTMSDQISSEPLMSTILATDQVEQANESSSVEDVQIHISENDSQLNDQDEQNKSNELFIDTIEGSEEEIQKQQIANIYRLLEDQNLINNWTATDFLDQLKMYGLHGYEENENESSANPIELNN